VNINSLNTDISSNQAVYSRLQLRGREQSGQRPRGSRPDGPRAGIVFLGRGQPAPSPPARESGGALWGPGRSPGRRAILPQLKYSGKSLCSLLKTLSCVRFLGGGLITHLGEVNHSSPRRLGSGFLSCCFNAYVVNKFHDNEHCSCSEWLSCLWHQERQVRHSLFWHNAEGWRSRKTSRSRPCKVSVSSRGKNQTSWSRGIAGRSWSRSRKLRSRSHPWVILSYDSL